MFADVDEIPRREVFEVFRNCQLPYIGTGSQDRYVKALNLETKSYYYSFEFSRPGNVVAATVVAAYTHDIAGLLTYFVFNYIAVHWGFCLFNLLYVQYVQYHEVFRDCELLNI